MLSETAICLTQEGAWEEALAVGEEACRVAQIKATSAELARRQGAQAGLLLKSGRPADALACLDGIAGSTPYHATEMALVRTEAFLRIGSAASAQDWLREAYRRVNPTPSAQVEVPHAKISPLRQVQRVPERWQHGQFYVVKDSRHISAWLNCIQPENKVSPFDDKYSNKLEKTAS